MIEEDIKFKIDELQQLTKEILPDDTVRIQKDVGGAYDLYIEPKKDYSSQEFYQPEKINISIDTSGYIFMTIDGYSWEFDDNFELAKKEITKYLQAVQKKTLKKKGFWIFNNRLSVDIVDEN